MRRHSNDRLVVQASDTCTVFACAIVKRGILSENQRDKLSRTRFGGVSGERVVDTSGKIDDPHGEMQRHPSE